MIGDRSRKLKFKGEVHKNEKQRQSSGGAPGTVAQVQTGGVAYLAHVGGFIFGAAAAHFIENSRSVSVTQD